MVHPEGRPQHATVSSCGVVEKTAGVREVVSFACAFFLQSASNPACIFATSLALNLLEPCFEPESGVRLSKV